MQGDAPRAGERNKKKRKEKEREGEILEGRIERKYANEIHTWDAIG